MAKNTYIILLLLNFIIHFYCVRAIAQDISGVVVINVIKDKKAEVMLEHKRHVEEYGLKCRDCHHAYNPREGEIKPCVECHDISERKLVEGRRADLIKTSIMKNVYHDTCNPCHDKLQRTGKPFPKKCSVCHPIRVE